MIDLRGQDAEMKEKPGRAPVSISPPLMRRVLNNLSIA
jgi:hypothetical protein